MRIKFILLSFCWAISACESKKDHKSFQPSPPSVEFHLFDECDLALEKNAISYLQDLYRFSREPKFQSTVFGWSRSGSQRWIDGDQIYRIYQSHEFYKVLKKESQGFTCRLTPLTRVILGPDFYNLQGLHSATVESFLSNFSSTYLDSSQSHNANVETGYSALLPLESKCPESQAATVEPNLVRGYIGSLLLQYYQSLNKDDFFSVHSNKEILDISKKIQFLCSVWKSKSNYTKCYPDQLTIADPYEQKFEIKVQEVDKKVTILCAENDEVLRVFWGAQ
ncbi:MAG: hypothetical protein RJB66_24 [Pseudomonadota bacterium]|jgi:hypothetical protein